MERRIATLCWLGLLVPAAFLSWALWEQQEAADDYRTAWQIFWMGRADEAAAPGAEERFLAVHPGIAEDRAVEILVTGGAATALWYALVLSPQGRRAPGVG